MDDEGDNMFKTVRKGEWLHIMVPEEWDSKTVDWVFRHYWEAPKKLTHLFRMENKVLVDGSRANWHLPLKTGSTLLVKLFVDEEPQIIPTFHDIDILFEDDHVLVINKPAYMNTHPNNPLVETNTLMNAASFYLQSKGECRNIRQIHRLDRDTTGAILLAKHPLAGAILDNMLEKRHIKRTYIAAVHGLFQQKKGTIHLPIGRDRHHATKRRVSPSGQEATTHFQLVKEDKNKQLSYVKCWLETGRTHQIRVHLSHIGHSIVGDIEYGGKPLTKRQALHAAKLEFSHPLTKEKVICHAPVTDSLDIFKQIDIYSI
ncbi:RluA family pseudouridine synthase [Bacillus sp. MM2020_4]|uniref:RluA family pseudouridine synthase n=2 Tax=Bacillaceae TaxID=186817 RepID=UPI00325A8FCC